RFLHAGAVIALAATTAPLAAQDHPAGQASWDIQGLSRGFCVQLLLDPSSEALRSLPSGYRPLPASRASDLPVALTGVLQGQPEFAAWSPSRLCFEAVDSLHASQFTLTNHKGKHPHLFAVWTVSAFDSAGVPGEVALGLFASSSRMVRSARLAGQAVDDARLTVGQVPGEDADGIRRTDRRFQAKLGKTTVTWDGHPAGDSTAVQGAVETQWVAPGTRGGLVTGRVTLTPAFSRAMAGSLKIDGKNDFANALKASPTRFAGPEYFGGEGTIAFGP
ncbi:MAG TPA: hypothetical protein VFG66_07675, partial [Gemmatimonadales bacterium]|nr:hypothetical protein [Gemmatimonadales bacterium]